jgi:ABC-2 type transport system ATP-binding protein
VRGLDPSGFRARLKKVVEVCGLAQVLGKDIGTLSHGYRQRVGLGQALIHDPPILILDEPTSDLDPNEKAEVIRYIKEIGKDRTVLLSTHNLSEVEEACARAIIVSKGKVVADGPLDEIRAKTGSTRYVVTVDEKNGEGGKPAPTATQLQDALAALTGAKRVREMPTDENAHKFELNGQQDLDLRAEIFRLVVQKHWTLLELRRDAQSLDTVFRELTRGDERLDRGAGWADETEDDADDGDEDDEDDAASDEAAEDDAASDEAAEDDAASDEAAEDDKKEKSEG